MAFTGVTPYFWHGGGRICILRRGLLPLYAGDFIRGSPVPSSAPKEKRQSFYPAVYSSYLFFESPRRWHWNPASFHFSRSKQFFVSSTILCFGVIVNGLYSLNSLWSVNTSRMSAPFTASSKLCVWVGCLFSLICGSKETTSKPSC